MFKPGQKVKFQYRNVSPHVSIMRDYDQQIGIIIQEVKALPPQYRVQFQDRSWIILYSCLTPINQDIKIRLIRKEPVCLK